MAELKLKKYTNDDDALIDISDAEFAKKKLTDDMAIDCSGVASIAAECLDVILRGLTPESVGDRIKGTNPSIDAALVRWVERSASPIKLIETRPVRPQVRRPSSTSSAGFEGRAPSSHDRFTPTRLMQRLRTALRGYIESAYPLSDPTLVRARRVLLESEAGGHLLAQEPFIETTTRYKVSDKSFVELGLPGGLGEFLQKLSKTPTQAQAGGSQKTILFPQMYLHQQRAFQSYFVARKDIVVATGTGSGKTECFLIPILGALYQEAVTRPASFKRPGVRALILYPMNALVNDQLSRLRLIFGELELANTFAAAPGGRFPRFGMYTGRTSYPGPRSGKRDAEDVEPLLNYYLKMDKHLINRLSQLGRYPAKDLQAFYAPHEAENAVYKTGKDAGKQYIKHHWERRLHTSQHDRELLTRHEMVNGVGTHPGHAPDILVTNYSMLEYMLMRPFERPIFEETRRWLEQDGNQLILVLDEAHMYRGAKGAEVAFLLRRLRARLGIHDRPEKLRVIATSASLGSDEMALNTVRNFAADLTGKAPADFDPITGTREVPEPAIPASIEDAAVFASLNLDKLNQALDATSLREQLEPLLHHYGVGDVPIDPLALASSLYDVLDGKPFVNQLICETAGHAVALPELAKRVFPEASQAQRALEALLTLGALARRSADSPGLIPTRVHGMFRGLHGLYACINPRCAGRQANPGEPALVGKLFSFPVASCDACGARVFELASCRSCGSPYLLAYVESGRLALTDFLWGEMEGNLQKVELLPSSPRYSERTERIRVHLKTGYLDAGVTFHDDEVSELHFWLDDEGARQASFDRCAMCQLSPSSRSRILDFRTRGEQPFTALIEAQFAEQPPQKLDARLPNHGRKVLVFSDGRQKAARLAPALEHSHARDLFRQVMALAASALREQLNDTGLHLLYPAVVWLCSNRGYDIFPSADEVEFRNHLQRVRGKSLALAVQLASRGGLRPTKSFAQALFSELTDRYYSLASLALGTIDEDPMIANVFDGFPDVGLDREAVQVLFRAWVRLHLERRTFRSDGAELRDLGEGWAGPEGINAERIQHVLPNRFQDYLSRVLGGDTAALVLVTNWFQSLVRNSELLDFEGDLYYFHPLGLSLNLRLHKAWLRCVDCGRIHPEALADTCPGCCGHLVEADAAYLEARTGFYREQVLRAFDPSELEPFGLMAAEHSAQLTGKPDESAFNKVEEYELRFQDIPLDGKPPIDVLSCTTTMEVGIDIGALSGVALRNVPPHVSNYQQRAGRAGRRGRSIASVITYAHGTSHDAHFFAHPEAIISGNVRAPIVYVENQQVLSRHINAYLVQRFFHEQVSTDTASRSFILFESLGKVVDFLSEEHPCSLSRLEAWLQNHQSQLAAELIHWVPSFSFGLNEAILGVEDTIADAVPHLLKRLREVLPVTEFPRRESVEGLEREALEQRLDENLLEALIAHAVFPRYAFPTDVVAFWVSKARRPGTPAGMRKYDYEPQRDLQLALTEYAPGRSLTIDKWRFESAGLYSPYDPTPESTLAGRQPYTSCKECGYVSLEPSAASLLVCPCCGGNKLRHTNFVTPLGFAPDINVKREVDRGQPVVYAGMTDRARLELQDPPTRWHRELFDGRVRVWTGTRRLAVVNKGVDDRGFRICPACGRSEPEFGRGFTRTTLMRAGRPLTHLHPLEPGVQCTAVAEGPYYLGHRFPTDTLLVRLKLSSPMSLGKSSMPGLLSRAARMALTSLVEAIALAASRELQIDEGELSGWWSPVLDRRTDEAQIYLYDLLPGGAGYARAVAAELKSVLEATERLLDDCDCASSCYRCIRHYGNHFIHASLDRHLALDLLRHILRGTIPQTTLEQKKVSLVGLREYLRQRGIATQEDVVVGNTMVPLIVLAPSGSIWLDLHHPLVNPELEKSRVSMAAELAFQEVVELDGFSTVHDLPSAVAALHLT